ncbi:MAG TPA: PQQ-binding-like beta-propeller repeat protein [Gaiellaceae bacterium]|nr:PQQ-binding-like beta-propeller repeat protein [Gaiellaceae bacterium]
MRRLALVAAILIVLGGAIGAAYYESTHRFGGSVRGTTTEFDPTETVAVPQPSAGSLLSPMFAGVPQHLHVGAGRVRPPFRLDWVTGGTSLIEFPPAIGFHYLYYASLNGNLIAVSSRNGRRLWTDHVGRCEAAGPALSRLGRGTVFETFLNPVPCGRGTAKGEGEIIAVAAGPGHALRWRKTLGVTETSPVLVGNRIYVADYGGRVYCLRAVDGRTLWTYQAGGAVKGAITYDRGRVFFGSYDGRLYALRASDGKLIWRAQSNRDWLGGHGQFYSTPSVAYSRVYLGSTDGHVYSFGERSGKLRWSYRTGGFVYGSPAIWRHRVLVGSYDHYFYALDAATGTLLWRFHANGEISGSATVVDGIVYFSTLERRTYGLDARTGKQVWTFPDGAFTPVVTDGKRIYVIGWAKLYAFSPRRGLQGSSSGP